MAGSILFLTPCFLSRRLHKRIRGVEVFDLLFVRQMVELGCDLTVAADASWRARFDDLLCGAMPEVVYTPSLRKPLPCTIAAAALLRRRRFDRLVLGNVARGMLPGVRLMRRLGVVERGALIAHRDPRPPLLRALRRWPLHVVAVSETIAAPFRGAVAGEVSVYYGLPNAGLFTPREAPAAEGEPVHFFLLGKMDSPLKGVDIALESFALMPPEVRARCRLHLASYQTAPGPMPEGVVAHEWMPAEAIPDFIRGMDVLLIPSRVESFSQVIVQAMLCGLPAIVSDLPVLVEKLDAGGGFVCRTPAEYAEAMTRLALDPALRAKEGAAARRTAQARYVWDTRTFVERFL